MKKILMVSERFLNGGLETHLLTYAQALSERGYKVFLATESEKLSHVSYKGFEKVYHLENDNVESSIGLINQIDNLSKIVKEQEIDIIHAHPFLCFISSFFVAQKFKLPFLMTIHGPLSIENHLGEIYELFLKVIFANKVDIIVVSQELKSMLFPYYEQISILTNPINTDKFIKVEVDKNIYKKCALISRLDEDKRDSIQSFIEQAILLDIEEIVIYGDGSLKDEIEIFIDVLRDKIKVHIQGYSNAIEQDLMKDYTVVAGMGRVVLEAASMNIPVILVGYDGIKGLVDKKLLNESSQFNLSGRGLKTISIKELKQQMIDYGENPKKYMLREVISESFSIAHQVAEYHTLLQTLEYKKCDITDKMYGLISDQAQKNEDWIGNSVLINNFISLFSTQYLLAKNMALLESKKLILDKDKKIFELNNIKKEKEQSILEKENIIQEKDKIVNKLIHQLNTIYNSNFWKLASKYYAIKEKPLLRPLVKIAGSIKNNGILATCNKVIYNIFKRLNLAKNEKTHKIRLQEILEKHKDKTIIILPVLVEWSIPLFQRPQHLAKNISKQGILYFYCTPNGQYDQVNGFDNVSEGCYLTNRFDLVDGIDGRKKVYDLSSTDNNNDWSFVEKRLNRGDRIIYQYIDEISEEISGIKIPKEILEKHFNILKDERCIVIPSATKLENDVKKYRNKNFKLVTNGVEVGHFSQKFPKEQYPKLIKEIILKNKPIIGYFGAFASWFDYELIIKLAKERENLEIVLLGVDYDGSIKKYQLEQYANITVAGPIDYKQLPLYSSCFDVSIIPFVINDITESTSPIKLFEYMAMGKPIVTTDMPECRKYKSVLIGKDHNDFIVQIEKALLLKDDNRYLETLKKEALENSWESKARDIALLIE